jgi:hypothetical protein
MLFAKFPNASEHDRGRASRNACMIVVASSVIALGGCETSGSNRIAFDHASASQQQLFADRAECQALAKGTDPETGGTGINQGIFRNCLAGKGYTRNDATGRLEVPDNLVIQTY